MFFGCIDRLQKCLSDHQSVMPPCANPVTGQKHTTGASRKPHVLHVAGCGAPVAPHDGMCPTSHFTHVYRTRSSGRSGDRFRGVTVVESLPGDPCDEVLLPAGDPGADEVVESRGVVSGVCSAATIGTRTAGNSAFSAISAIVDVGELRLTFDDCVAPAL